MKASQITAVADVEILNPDLVICTLDHGARIRMELTINSGKGYVAAERNRPEDAPIGLIPVDSLFSPVRKVSYHVENTREGQILDYDKLTIDVETNGAHHAGERGRLRGAHSSGPALDLHQLRRAAREEDGRAEDRICRSTRRCSRRSTNSNSRCVRPTA